MVLGVLSDTHIYGGADGFNFLQRIGRDYFSDAEAILHAGDMIDATLMEAFSPVPVYGVRGNMDAAHPDLPLKRVLQFEGFCIGMIHGWGPTTGLVERILKEFCDIPLDCLIFGHSHYPLNERRGNLLLFNPGSPTDPRKAPFPTVGRLYLEESLRGEIIPVE